MTKQVSNRKGELAKAAEAEKAANLVKAEMDAINTAYAEFERLRGKIESEVEQVWELKGEK